MNQVLRPNSARNHLNWLRPSSDVANHRMSASTFLGHPVLSEYIKKTLFYFSITKCHKMIDILCRFNFLSHKFALAATASLYDSLAPKYFRSTKSYKQLVPNITLLCYVTYKLDTTYIT